jgi:hypothetical protein
VSEVYDNDDSWYHAAVNDVCIPMAAYTDQSSCSENCGTSPTSIRRHRYNVVANKSNLFHNNLEG